MHSMSLSRYAFVLLGPLLLPTLSAASQDVDNSTGAPNLKGNSSYISTEANENVRARIDVYDDDFIVKPVGRSPNVGAGSHEGGAISVKDLGRFYQLTPIGILIPKPGVTEWSWPEHNLDCQRLDLSDDTYSTFCRRMGSTDQFTTVVSQSRGILSFTGHCHITKDELCEYVLISDRGIAHP